MAKLRTLPTRGNERHNQMLLAVGENIRSLRSETRTGANRTEEYGGKGHVRTVCGMRKESPMPSEKLLFITLAVILGLFVLRMAWLLLKSHR